ncbi:MAG: GAF domain-containing protein [Cyanobacteria bacterium]|nr:GAF domain-containing protein [Cyanobacteria bacterium CG_2015-16_32_12]NCO77725.1 GAF domain-containing protein [Cyanobacteria bacterium CG_2015-22_32_23]NCQ03029.1 GAF domain-containing protein [Cyanobacteria bacterium CG_2015-09_32_10]NCQ40930.1 GAF domain-containing protein [Cyanobacteria bacterium CG_2015-04_32_10]NCS83596.1 GAF domain-containing protein [Cyanobacteria bacterium CG_2015-02_32_10]
MTLNPLEHNAQNLSSLGAELVFTQDILGHYHSFYWRSSRDSMPSIDDDSPPLSIDDLTKIKLFPIQKQTYLECIERVLTRKIPEQCHYIFSDENYSFPFNLIISPIILFNGDAKLVLVMGNSLKKEEVSLIPHGFSNNYPESYQKLLINISRKIRRTLDLETIWQQTVDSIGLGLKVNRCLIIVPSYDTDFLEIKAEYCDPRYNSLLGFRFNFHDYEEVKKAILFRQPTTINLDGSTSSQALSVLLVPTFYQQEFNSIICLHQCDHQRQWNESELELVQELGDQVGTAIAQGTIYQKLEQANAEAKEASRLKSEFLASTSHELRTPLNGILGFLKLVLDDMADDIEEEREFIDQAYHSALHLLNLINDILDIAKIEAGKLEFNLDSISLNSICEEIYKFAHNQAQKKNIYFKINLPSTYDEILLQADYQRLLQVMLNLVGNSLKFTHEGGIEITAEIISKKFSVLDVSVPGMVKINVADTGIGVSLDKQEKLFETFYQVDGSRTKAYGGTGLGLAISKRLIEAMGGKISFYSMGESLGSTVTLTVPLSQLPILKTEK